MSPVTMQSTTKEFSINDFVEKVLSEAGFRDLPDDVMDRYRRELSEEVQNRIGIIALQELDPNGLKAFDEFTAQNANPSPQVLFEFFKKNVPEFQQKIVAGLIEFANQFIKNTRTTRVQLSKT